MLYIYTKTARTAPHWLSLMVERISEGVSLKEILSECIDMIAKLCKRAHPKRDLKDGPYQFCVISLGDI
jgi:hypothetical protein